MCSDRSSAARNTRTARGGSTSVAASAPVVASATVNVKSRPAKVSVPSGPVGTSTSGVREGRKRRRRVGRDVDPATPVGQEQDVRWRQLGLRLWFGRGREGRPRLHCLCGGASLDGPVSRIIALRYVRPRAAEGDGLRLRLRLRRDDGDDEDPRRCVRRGAVRRRHAEAEALDTGRRRARTVPVLASIDSQSAPLTQREGRRRRPGRLERGPGRLACGRARRRCVRRERRRCRRPYRHRERADLVDPRWTVRTPTT